MTLKRTAPDDAWFMADAVDPQGEMKGYVHLAMREAAIKSPAPTVCGKVPSLWTCHASTTLPVCPRCIKKYYASKDSK